MNNIHTPEEYRAAAGSSDYTVMLWTANWCPDCIFLKPFLKDLEAEFSDMKFYSVDRDELLDLAAEENILGIPSFIVYKDGKVTGRFVSKLRKTKKEIEDFLTESRN